MMGIMTEEVEEENAPAPEELLAFYL